jgi:hypothetical protein
MLLYSCIISSFEEVVQMAFNQRDFRKDKAKPVMVRRVCGVKILTVPCLFRDKL